MSYQVLSCGLVVAAQSTVLESIAVGHVRLMAVSMALGMVTLVSCF